VFAIREAATSILAALADKFGGDWTRAHLLPRVQSLSIDTNYLHRLTCLFCINILARPCGAAMTKECFVPILLKLAEDKVPNVRFNVAKTLQKIGPVLDHK
jgi:serine/threonine-protein phosphatase 2A regulatory subunit A